MILAFMIYKGIDQTDANYWAMQPNILMALLLNDTVLIQLRAPALDVRTVYDKV